MARRNGLARWIIAHRPAPPAAAALPAASGRVDVETEAWACVTRFERRLGRPLDDGARAVLHTEIAATIRRVSSP